MPPVNDLWANATIIASLPFSDATIDLTTATASPDDPLMGAASTDGSVNPGNHAIFQTVWWKWTPAVDMVVQASTTNTIPLGIFIGTQPTLVEVVSNWNVGLTTATWQARGGTTYYLMIGNYFGTGGTTTLTLDVSTAPPNQFQITATPITTLPFTVTVDAALALDNNHRLWWSYTSPVTQVINIFPFRAGGGVNPALGFIYQPPVNYEFPVAFPDASLPPDIGADVPTYLGLSAGQTIYIQIRPEAFSGSLSFSLTFQVFTCQDTTAGNAFLQLADVEQWPACIIDATTGNTLQLPFPFASDGAIAILADGTLCTYDTPTDRLILYNSQLVQQLSIPLPAPFDTPVFGSPGIFTNTQQTHFYVTGVTAAGSTFAQTLSATGVFGPLLGPFGSLFGSDPNATAGLLGVSPDETVGYVNTLGNGGCTITGTEVSNVGSIARWDMVNNVRLFPDLTPTPPLPVIDSNHAWAKRDLLVLTDGTVLVGFIVVMCLIPDPPPLAAVKILRYVADGSQTVLNTYTYPATGLQSEGPTFCRATDDPASFWFYRGKDSIPDGETWKDIYHVRVSDGTNLEIISPNQFTAGELELINSANPPPAFYGPSNTRMVLLPQAVSCSGSPTPPPPSNVTGCPNGLPLPPGGGAACGSGGVISPSA